MAGRSWLAAKDRDAVASSCCGCRWGREADCVPAHRCGRFGRQQVVKLEARRGVSPGCGLRLTRATHFATALWLCALAGLLRASTLEVRSPGKPAHPGWASATPGPS